MKVNRLAPGPRRAWQVYLADRGLYPAELVGDSSKVAIDKLVEATEAHKTSVSLTAAPAMKAEKAVETPPPSPKGEITEADVEFAIQQDPKWRDRIFTMGPVPGRDLRRLRPYFLVPLGDAALPGESAASLDDIKKTRTAPVTDIYVLSHGWHRNLLSGVAAYDKLMSRFSILLARGRLSETKDVAPPADFNPLFVAMHWNSDPGDDRWTDKSGRRHKSSFIDNCRSLFAIPDKGSEAEFLKDFEDMFEFMSTISVSDIDALDPSFDAVAQGLTAALDKYPIRSCPPGSDRGAAAKASIVWRCYFEAQNKALLTDQPEKPRPIGNGWTALSAMFKFVAGAAGLVAVAKFVNGKIPWDGVKDWFTDQWDWIVEKMWSSYDVPLWQKAVTGLGLYVGASLLLSFALYLFWVFGFYCKKDKKAKKRSGSSFSVTGVWLLTQVLLTVPVLVFLLVTFVFRSIWILAGLAVAIYMENWWVAAGVVGGFTLLSVAFSAMGRPVPWLYDEKADSKTSFLTQRDVLAALARLPIRWLRDILPADTVVMRLAETMDTQFAFFEMQRKGATVGKEAGEFLDKLVTTIAPDGPLPKIHFVGHSFGGLVITNAAARYLALRTAGSVQSLCLVQAAIASNWFEGQESVVNSVQGAISNVYSAYDTANGFYYPFANNGRLAAGYVGLSNVGASFTPAPVGRFAMLVRPPELPAMGAVKARNLDASRLIYEGGVATGGGHDDIFKDDVVNLIWSATRE